MLNTNARSLCPKISSLIDSFNDLSASVGIITETWLTDWDSLEGLVLRTGLKMICKNRDPNERGYSHGGVAVAFKEPAVTLKEVRLHNPRKFEVLLTSGTIRGCSRKLCVV